MEDEDIKRIECLIEKCKQCKLNACITCDICWSEVQAIENLLSRLKTAERMNDVLAERLEKDAHACLDMYGANTKDWLEWARKKVEDDSSCSNER